jgi:prepilin-type N-terminal cleavage/methylation domain-containing protein
MKRSPGFTLIEVLIASVIMLTVLSLAANLFAQARLSSQKAQDSIMMQSPLVLIMDTIRHQIRQDPQESLSGDGVIDDVQYKWTASTELFLPPPDNLIPESNQVVSFAPRYRLYQVQLELKYKASSRAYQFKEVAWLQKAQAQ